MSIIEFLCVLVLGYVLGNIHTIWKLRKLISDVAKNEGINLDDAEVKSKNTAYDVHKLQIETIGDILYLYNIETKDFVCQGSSIDELATLTKTHRIMVATVAYDDKVFMFVNGKYKEFIA